MRRRGDQTVGLVRSNDLIEIPEMVLDGRRRPREIDPDPSPVHGYPEIDQGVLGGVEVVALGEAGSGAETPIESIGPAVIGAADLAGVEGITDRRQLVTPMTTHIGEGAQGSIRIPAEKDALAADIDRTKLTRGDELVETPHTIPGRLPEMLSLPGQDILGEVDVGREGETRTEWIEDPADLFRVNRCRIHPDSLLPP